MAKNKILSGKEKKCSEASMLAAALLANSAPKSKSKFPLVGPGMAGGMTDV